MLTCSLLFRLVRIEKEILLGALEHVKSTGVKAHNGAFGSVTISDPGSDAAFCG